MPSPPDVSIVTVGYNTRELVLDCMESLQCCGAVIEVLLIDSSSDGTAEAVAARYPRVRVLPSRENLGFTRGNNRGLRIARGRHLLLLNPDTAAASGAIERMVVYLDQHPDVGAVGPKLLYGDGAVQPSRYRFPARWTAFVEGTVLQRVLDGALDSFYIRERSHDELQDVDWLRGACLMVRREVAAAVGLLDEGFFMYSEEVDLCRRIRTAGWRIIYLPEAVVVHHEGRSSEQNVAARDIRFHESRIRYYAKHHGRGWAGALRVAVLANYLFLAAEESVKLALGHRRELRRQRLHSIRQVIGAQARRLVSV